MCGMPKQKKREETLGLSLKPQSVKSVKTLANPKSKVGSCFIRNMPWVCERKWSFTWMWGLAVSSAHFDSSFLWSSNPLKCKLLTNKNAFKAWGIWRVFYKFSGNDWNLDKSWAFPHFGHNSCGNASQFIIITTLVILRAEAGDGAADDDRGVTPETG